MKLKWFKILVIPVIISSCSHTDTKTESFEPFLKSKLQLNKYLSTNYSLGLFKYFYDSKSKEEYFTYLDENKKSIIFFRPTDTSIVKTISVDRIPNFEDYDILSFDSIYFLHNTSRSISLLANEKIQNWKVESAIPTYGSEYVINTWYPYPLSHNKGELLVYNFPLEVLKNKPTFQRYYSTARDCHLIIDSSGMKIKSLSGKYFSRYNENTHYVFFPTRTIGKNGTIIYSFDDSDTILIYDDLNNNYREVILENPLFRENSAFDQTRTMDHNYLTQYYTENDRFNNFIFDPFHNIYYRIMGKGSRFTNSDGTINRDKEFFILVYDDSFKLIKQIAFPFKIYDQFILFCTKDLVYLVTSTNFSDPIMHLHGFKFL